MATAAAVRIRPLHDRVIVQRLEEGEQKIGGIIIPDSAKEKPQQGKVIAVGQGKVKDRLEVAVAAARMFGASDVRVTLAYIGDSYQGTPSVLLDVWDLDEAAQELRDLWRKIHAGPQPPNPPDHRRPQQQACQLSSQ